MSERIIVSCPVAAAPLKRRRELLMELARELHAAGAPCDRLEEVLDAAAAGMGVKGEFFATPTSLFAGFGGRAYFVRTHRAEVDLERLSLLDGIVRDLLNGTVSARKASQRVREVRDLTSRYPGWLTRLAAVTIAAAAAVLFGGGVTDVVAAALVGLVIALGVQWGIERRTVPAVTSVLAGTAAALIASLCGAVLPGVTGSLVILSGLIILVPGFEITTAVRELSGQHLIAGSSRLAGALLTLVAMAFGVAIGLGVGASVPAHGGTAVALGPIAFSVAVLVAPVAAAVLFRAPLRALPAMWLVSVAGYGASHAVGRISSIELGALAGAFTLGIVGRWLAKRVHEPAEVLLTPGLLLLVPGSMGFRSLLALVEQDATLGVTEAFRVSVVALALVVGMLVSAGVRGAPRRALAERVAVGD